MSISQPIEHNSRCLTRSFSQTGWGRSLQGVLGLTLALGLAHKPARADRLKTAQPELKVDARLRGVYVAVGPVGVALRSQGNWDSAFGGELNITRVREGALLSALGVSAGAVSLSKRDGGRLWFGGLVGLDRLIARVPLGLGLGAAVDVDDVRHPRLGGYATLWFYAGVMPFVRVSAIQKSGGGVELGLSIPLPALKL